MNRSSFLRSLFVLVAAPKVLAKIKIAPEVKPTSQLFKDLNFVTPDYIPSLIAKYGGVSFGALMGHMGNISNGKTSFYHYEKVKNEL